MVRGPVFLARLAQDENAEFLRRRSKKESVETWDTIKRLSYNLLWQHSGRQGTICYNSERSPPPAVAFCEAQARVRQGSARDGSQG